MPEPLDPYYHWLGIPPREHPPNHYRLLSLQLFEPNLDVIQHAVDRVMTHLRTFQGGKRASDSQKLLNEVARAKICLLDPAKKAEYDKALRKKLQPLPDPPPPGTLSSRSPAPEESATEETPSNSVEVSAGRSVSKRLQRRRSSARLLVTVTAVLGLVGSLVAWYYWRPASTVGRRSASQGNTSVNDGEPSNPPAKTSDTPLLPPPSNVNPPGQTPKPRGDVGGKKSDSKPTTQPTLTYRREPLAEGTRKAIEAAAGLVTDRLAFCQDLTLDSFRSISEQMRPHGYRPSRLRPYVTGDKLAVAAIWIRDGVPWRLELSTSAKTLADITRSLGTQGFVPVDVSGYDKDIVQYLGLYAKLPGLSSGIKTLIGASIEQQQAAATSWANDGFALTTLHEFVDRNGAHRLSQIWKRHDAARAALWFRVGGVLQADQPLLSELAPPYLPMDVLTVPRSLQGKPRLMWFVAAIRKAAPAAVLSGFDLRQHLDKCRQLARQGYLPSSISVTPFQNQLVAASIWHLPGGAPPSDDQLVMQLAGPLPAAMTTSGPSETGQPEGPAQQPTSRPQLEIPSSATLKAATRVLEETYEDMLAAARKSPNNRILAIRKLIKEANAEKDPALRYAEFQRAASLAVQIGHVDLALLAIDHMADHFKVNGLKLKAAAIKEMLRGARSPLSRRVLAWIAFNLSERSRLAEQFGLAEQLASAAGNAGRTARDRALQRVCREQKQRIKYDKQLATDGRNAQETLAQNPTDPTAALAAGKYLCFVRHDWKVGFALLAKSGDQQLIHIVTQELAQPKDPRQQLALARAWTKWAEAEDMEAQIGAWQRAVHWYARALPELPNDTRPDVRTEMVEVDQKLMPWLWSTARQLPWLDGPEGTLRTRTGTNNAVASIATSRNGRLAVIGYDNGDVRIWDLVGGDELGRRLKLLPRLRHVVMAGDSPLVVCDNGGSKLALWDLKSGNVTGLSQPKSIGAVAGARAETIFTWALATDSKKNLIVWNPTLGTRKPLNGPDDVRALALSSDGRLLLLGTGRQMLVSVDLLLGKELNNMKIKDTPRRIQFSPDGRFIHVAYASETEILDALNGKPVCQFPSNSAHAVFLPRTNILLVVTQEAENETAQLDFWSIPSGQQVRSISVILIDRQARLTAIAALPDPRAVVVGDQRGNVYLIRLPDK